MIVVQGVILFVCVHGEGGRGWPGGDRESGRWRGAVKVAELGVPPADLLTGEGGHRPLLGLETVTYSVKEPGL